MALLWIILGLAALIVGAELVVRYGAKLARQFGLPPILVGLTVVALGTSAPELAVGIDAMSNDAGALAIGNIAGTNIVNLLLILGLSAAIAAIPMELQTLRLDLPMMAGASVLLFLLAVDGSLHPWEGVPLLALGIVYTVLLVRWTKKENARVLAEFADGFPAERVRPPLSAVLVRAGLLLAGLAIIVLGADWLVDGSVELARELGVSDALIGLTIVAIGTSAPELATTVVSTIRGDRDIAIGNLIGSSTYNLTFILGVSLFFAPGQVVIEPELRWVDLPVMVAVALVCVPLFLSGKRLSRLEGGLFVAGYFVYLGYLLLTRT